MARARDVILGVQKRRRCSVTAIDGQTELEFAITLLPSTASGKIAENARDYAKARGVADPKLDDVQYLRGKLAHTILTAAVDLDSPPEASVAYFDDVAQIERMLDDAAQVFVVQEQKDFQDEHAPLGEGCTPEQYVQLQAAVLDEFQKGGDPERPFVGLPLRVLRSFAARQTAQSYPLTDLLSQLGSRSRDATQSSSSSAPTSESGG